MVTPVGVEITAANLLPKLEELPMLQLLETPPRFSSSCPPSIAGSPPSSASGFGSYQLPSPQSATTSINLSTSCGSSPPKSMSPGHQTPKYYRSQPSSPATDPPGRVSVVEAAVSRNRRSPAINALLISMQSIADDAKYR